MALLKVLSLLTFFFFLYFVGYHLIYIHISFVWNVRLYCWSNYRLSWSNYRLNIYFVLVVYLLFHLGRTWPDYHWIAYLFIIDNWCFFSLDFYWTLLLLLLFRSTIHGRRPIIQRNGVMRIIYRYGSLSNKLQTQYLVRPYLVKSAGRK